jgi:hypothetical protein
MIRAGFAAKVGIEVGVGHPLQISWARPGSDGRLDPESTDQDPG